MEPIDALVTTTFLALVVAWIIEIVRKHLPSLDGDLLRLVTVILGYAAAFGWSLDVATEFGFGGLPAELGYLATAFVIAGEAGIIGSAKNALRARDPLSSLYPPVSVELETSGVVPDTTPDG